MFRNGQRILIVLFCIVSVFSIELGPGTPVPHSEELKRMIIKYVFDRPSDIDGDSMLDYISGKSATLPNPEDEFRDLNISVLDPNGIRKIAQMAKEKHWEEQMNMEVNTSKISRRTYTWPWKYQHQAWEKDTKEARLFMNQGVDWMQQAIFATRYNLKRTKPLRKRYANNYLFHIGTQFGMLMQMRVKMETTHHVIYNMSYGYMKFHWYIILYEKLLQAHTDVSMTVQRMFELYKVFKQRRNDPVFMYSYTNPLDV